MKCHRYADAIKWQTHKPAKISASRRDHESERPVDRIDPSTTKIIKRKGIAHREAYLIMRLFPLVCCGTAVFGANRHPRLAAFFNDSKISSNAAATLYL